MIKKQLALQKRTVETMLRIDNKRRIPWTMIVCLWPRDWRMRKNWEDSKRHLQEWGVGSGSRGRRLHTRRDGKEADTKTSATRGTGRRRGPVLASFMST